MKAHDRLKVRGLSIIVTLFVNSSCTHADSEQAQTRNNTEVPTAQHIDNSTSPVSNCNGSTAVEHNPEKQKSFESVRLKCQSEIAKLCQSVECPTLMKLIQVCLMTFDDELSKECKKDINRHIKAFQPFVKPLSE